jgi:hypothetical protein
LTHVKKHLLPLRTSPFERLRNGDVSCIARGL